MFKKARLKLTFFYSLVFLLFFWLSNIALYSLVSRSLGDDPSLVKLRDMLFLLNIYLIFFVPFIAWFFTFLALKPVQEIHEQQKQFMSDVSHELRTPLSILSSEIDVALKKPRQTVFYKQILTSNKQEVDRLAALVGNLLFLAKEDQRQQTIKFERVDITDLLGEVIVSLRDKSVKKKISVSFAPADEAIVVLGQPLMLKQLFLNIIDNALNYTPINGNVQIYLEASQQYARIKVKDSGIGIAKQDQKKIFERFYRVDSSRSQVIGYGLGLSLCQSIVKLHRGNITVYSRLGKGSVFTVLLPQASR